MKRADITDAVVVQAAWDLQRRDHPAETHLITLLMQRTGAPEKVCYAAAFRANSRDLLDYGVSIRRAFLAEKGYVLLGIVPNPYGDPRASLDDCYAAANAKDAPC